MRIVVIAALLLPFTATTGRPATNCTPGPYVVFFDPGSAVLKREQVAILEQIVENVGFCGSVPHLEGHADTAERRGIVRDRLRAVAAYFETRGLFVKPVNIRDVGARRPRVTTGPNVSERQNRRVEIVFTS